MRNSPEAWDERAELETSWDAALWSEQGQRKRFGAILGHLSLRGGDTILDYGCGTGRLAEFLPRNVSYVGYDWSLKMRERAKREHPEASVISGLAPDAMYDHVVCCGTFNLADNWTHDGTWQTFRDLWRRHTDRSLLVSLYRGTDPACLRYDLDECAKFVWGERIENWLVDGMYARNDLLLCCFR